MDFDFAIFAIPLRYLGRFGNVSNLSYFISLWYNHMNSSKNRLAETVSLFCCFKWKAKNPSIYIFFSLPETLAYWRILCQNLTVLMNWKKYANYKSRIVRLYNESNNNITFKIERHSSNILENMRKTEKAMSMMKIKGRSTSKIDMVQSMRKMEKKGRSMRK